MNFLRLFQHLLPDGRAWRTTTDKRLRQFFDGLSVLPDEAKDAADAVWLDLMPDSTSRLSEWERQFGLVRNITDDATRRLRLQATWRALIGGQDPRYIQDTLRAAGFDVYVYEWWEPGTAPTPGAPGTPVPRNPLLYLRREYTGIDLLVECGEPLAECGEEFAECGNSVEPLGYPLVNKIYYTAPDVVALCGEDFMECGEAEAECGNFYEFTEQQKTYAVPYDPARWPYFLYIGGAPFGALAQIPRERQDEFEALCLKICPLQQWLGILVQYT